MKTRLQNFQNARNEIPTHNRYPGGKKRAGAQVIDGLRAMDIIMGLGDTDDWYSEGSYTDLILFDLEGCSGKSDVGYKAILEEDIDEMRVINIDTAKSVVMELSIELIEDGEVPTDEMGFAVEGFWHDAEDAVLEALWGAADSVEPSFVDTL